MNAIVETARSWIGTPFHHQARCKGAGVDCVGLVLCVAKELGYVAQDFDVLGYSRRPDGVTLMHHLHAQLDEVSQADMRPGDVVCVAFDALPQHVGVVGDYLHGGLSIIHADSRHKRVVETRLMFGAAMRFVAAFRFGDGVI